MLVLLTTLAFGQGQAELVEGQPEFENCLSDSDGCFNRFQKFLTHSMVEQGFTLQQHTGISAVTLPEEGVLVGVQLDTFPLSAARSNLAGKEENTEFSPVLPRLLVGIRKDIKEDLAISAAVQGFPPIPVGGASALVLGGEGGIAWRVKDKWRLGAELDVSYARARAPITATDEQAEDNPGNVQPETYAEVCDPKPNGCIDTFTVTGSGLRLAAGLELPHGFTPWVKLGAGYTNQRLDVEYDATGWRTRGIQPTAAIGTGWNRGVFVSNLGLYTAPRWENISEEDAGLLFKIQLTAGVAL